MKKFSSTLYMYSPKAYEFVREHLPLPATQTIRNWLSKLDGSPGILHESVEYLSQQSQKNKWAYGQCALMMDGMSIMSHVQYDQHTHSEVGYVDYGHGPEEALGRAKETVVFMASGLTSFWKMPVGYVLSKGKYMYIIFNLCLQLK